MTLKGYNIDSTVHHERLLNEFTNEYGFNLKHKTGVDILKTNLKPRNVKNQRSQSEKR